MKRFLFLLVLTPFLLLIGCDQNPSQSDTTKPTVQIALEGTTNTSGAYLDSAKVTVAATDTGGSGLSKTEYSLNGSSFQAYSQPFTLTTPGEYVVRARATDGASNVGESEKTFAVVKGNAPADAVDPTVTLTLNGTTDASGAYQGKATVTIAAADTGGSGLAAIQYSLDDAPFVPYTTPFEVGTSGSHTVTARASDNAANTTTETKTFTVVGGSADGDTTKPTVKAAVTGTERSPGVYENSATVTITAADEGGSGLAKTEYSLNGGPLQSYSAPFSVSTVGNHTVVARATDGANNIAEDTLTFQVVSSGAPTAPPPNAAGVTLENLDGAPYSDRLVFSRIQNIEDGTTPNPNGSCCKPPNVVHDTATLKITNTGSAPLNITALPIQGPWQLVSPPSLPTTVAVNASLNLTLKFVATGGDLNTGTMTIVSSATNNQYKVVELAGFWQSKSEGGQEPSLQELAELFGYTTTITKAGQSLDNSGRVETVGDEILSPYWQRADTGKPVTVRQLAAYHSQGQVSYLRWVDKVGLNASGFTVRGLLAHDEEEGQTVLPSRLDTRNTPTVSSFTPNGVFGFKVDNEWSDWSLNTTGPVTDSDGKTTVIDGKCLTAQEGNSSVVCGHHVRFWPVKDRTGAVIPNTYLLGMDYSGINYDFNDNVYLISNVKPAELVPYLIDVAGNGSYSNAEGTWFTDTGSGLFRPSTAKAENPGNAEIFGTDDDQLYWTYRGNVGSAPQGQRQLIYNLPVNAGTYTVTLYFAERFWEAPNKRVFDVSIEGQLRLDDFDIFSASGGKNTAVTRTFSNIQVTDGNLTIVFDPSMDYASIAAIKVTK